MTTPSLEAPLSWKDARSNRWGKLLLPFFAEDGPDPPRKRLKDGDPYTDFPGMLLSSGTHAAFA